MTDCIADPVACYLKILEELFAARRQGPLDDETEAHFAGKLNDWRSVMTREQEERLSVLISERQMRP